MVPAARTSCPTSNPGSWNVGSRPHVRLVLRKPACDGLARSAAIEDIYPSVAMYKYTRCLPDFHAADSVGCP